MQCRRWHWGDGVEVLRAALRRAEVLAIPTESSYGLAVDPRDGAAVERVCRIKGRELEKGLPVLVADVEQAHDLGVPRDCEALRQASRFWPGPLTVIVSLAEPLPASAADGSLAVRIPGHARLCTLLAELGHGLTATSANPSGRPPLTDAESVARLLVDCPSVLIDEGTLPGGAPSTLVRWERGEWRVLREGAIPSARLVPGEE